MDTKKSAKSKVGIQSVFVIYRPGKSPMTVSGTGVTSLDVRDGCLLLLNANGNATHALAPGQWLGVNLNPD